MTMGASTLAELTPLVEAGAVDTVILAFPDLFGRLMGKRLDARFFLRDPGGTHACDYLFTVDMEMHVVDGYDFASWAGGYGDFQLIPDLNTLRVLTWLDRTALVFCDAVLETGRPVRVAPRSILSQQIERAAHAGFALRAASELEYFIFRTGYREAADDDYRTLTPAGWYIGDYNLLQGTWTEDLNADLRRQLAASGVPVESTKGEAAIGQHEINIAHSPVLEMADRHVLVKQCCKEVAGSRGASVTFMAKPLAAQAGSGCHLHLSLWREDENAFAGRHPVGRLSVSDEFRWFLGGLIARAREFFVCFAPTVNAYRRFQAQSWAPTGMGWSVDNRTTAFRIVGQGPSLRIECRLPGADVNPYLAYAAVLAAGLDGIENKTEPPPPQSGDSYVAEDVPPLPSTLDDAAELFAGSSFARDAFGSDVVDHYSHFFRSELAAWHRAVTDWELRRYFERI